MKFERADVFNIEGAIYGMRNPLNSWAKSDSGYLCSYNGKDICDHCGNSNCTGGYGSFIIGERDMELAKRLINGGSEHRKFLRQIFTTIDITGPLYWWKELDTYKLGTTANSTSTMHKLTSTPITIDCFETDDMPQDMSILHDVNVHTIIGFCERLRLKYNETKDKKYWKELIRWLPESWLQTRTWTANYEVLRNIYHQRQNHKLTEWTQFCDFIATLPYAKEFICE